MDGGERLTAEAAFLTVSSLRRYDRQEMAKGKRQFDVVIEKDSDGFLVAWVPALPGCHTQARSLDELTKRIQEAIALCLEVGGAPPAELDFVGVQRVTVAEAPASK